MKYTETLESARTRSLPWRGLQAALLAWLRDRYLYAALALALVAVVAALALALVAVVAAYQVRMPFTLDVGGPIDRTLLIWVHDPQYEKETNTLFRWTTGGSEMLLSDWGAGNPVELRLRVTRWMPGNRIADLTVYVNGLELAEPQASGQGWQEYALRVTDPLLLESNDFRVRLETDTFLPKQEIPGSSDPRRLGIQWDSAAVLPLQQVNGQWRAVNGPVFSPFHLPPRDLALYFVACALGLYLALAGFALPRGLAFAGSALFAVAAAAGLVLARPYLTLFAGTFTLILLAGIGLAVVARLLSPVLLRWGGVRASAWDLNLLALLFGLALVCKTAFLLYPQTISFDLLYHVHRLEDVLRGVLFWSIPSGKNEFGGQPVPYLPSFYLFLAPFAEFVPLKLLVQLSGILLDSVTIFILYYWLKKHFNNGRAGLFAAWLYIVVPLAFIAISWGIYANIYGQFLTLLLAAALIECADALPGRRPLVVLTLLFTLTFLSHTSVLVSIVPLFGMWVAFLFVLGTGWRSRPLWTLVGVILMAATISYAVYYSQFIGLVAQGTQQIAAAAGDESTRSATGETLSFWDLLQPARTEFTAVHPYIYLSAALGFLLLAWQTWRTRHSERSSSASGQESRTAGFLGPTSVPRNDNSPLQLSARHSEQGEESRNVYKARGRFLLVAMLAAWFVALALLMLVRAEFGFSSRYVNFAMPALAVCAGAAWAALYDWGKRALALYAGRAAAFGLALLAAAQGGYHWFVLVMYKYH